jgi:hypothetical protein
MAGQEAGTQFRKSGEKHDDHSLSLAILFLRWKVRHLDMAPVGSILLVPSPTEAV